MKKLAILMTLGAMLVQPLAAMADSRSTVTKDYLGNYDIETHDVDSSSGGRFAGLNAAAKIWAQNQWQQPVYQQPQGTVLVNQAQLEQVNIAVQQIHVILDMLKSREWFITLPGEPIDTTINGWNLTRKEHIK